MIYSAASRRITALAFSTLLAAATFTPVTAAQELPKQHAIHMFDGEPEYAADFQNWNYVNPDAPRTGSITLGSFGSFDTLNHMNAKGDPAPNLASMYNTLLTSNSDEIDSRYGELAEWMQMAEDRTSIIFKIRDEAKWSDGKPVTPEDVIFTWEKQRAEGFEGFTQAYEALLSIEDLGGNQVKFNFDPEAKNRELPFVVGGEEIIPKHYWQDRNFGETTQDIPLGSGPYTIKSFDLGQNIVYELRDDYWAKDMPFNRGLNNIKTVRYDMYREITVMRKAAKAGRIDYRAENQAKAWATEYENMQDAIDAGVFVKRRIEDPTIQSAQGFFFNIQDDKFKDRNIRQAIGLAFDFEWSNKALFFNQYTRTNSHFQNSFLQAEGKPEGLELEILERFRGRVPDEVFGEPFVYPQTDGSGNARRSLGQALRLFKKAGYSLKDQKLVNDAGEQLKMEYVTYSPDFERILVPWMENLRKIGVDANARVIEPNQWLEKIRERDFEMTGYTYSYGYTPGTQVDYNWSSRLAQTKGSIAFHGVENPVLDELIKEMIETRDRPYLNALTRALDRILTHEHYLVLQWHAPFERLLYWDKFGIPETKPKFASGALSTWWIDEEKAATLEERRKNLTQAN